MTKEALDLALEALESERPYLGPMPSKTVKAITAIKQALAAQPEPNGWAISYDGKTPYAIWPEGDGPLLDLEVKRQGGTCCKLQIYTTPPAQPAPVQEPWKYRRWDDVKEQWELTDDSGWPSEPIYTAPPAAQRQWVGLTDELRAGAEPMFFCGAKWAERILKEKNNG